MLLHDTTITNFPVTPCLIAAPVPEVARHRHAHLDAGLDVFPAVVEKRGVNVYITLANP